VCQVSLQSIRREFIRGFALRTRRFIHRAQQIVRDMQVVLSCRGALGSSVPHPRQVGDPLSATCRRSEISSPAIRYFPLKLAPGQRLLARCEDLLADAAEFLAELRHHRFRCVAVLPGAIIGSFCHNPEGATLLMPALMVTANRLFWRRMYRLATTRFKLET